VHISNSVSLHNVLELHRVEQIIEILPGRLIGKAEVGKVRHTTGQKVLLEDPRHRLIRRNRTVQLQKLCEGEWIDHKLDIASSQVGCELTEIGRASCRETVSS